MQEDQVILPLARAQGGVGSRGKILSQLRQLVIVGREQSAARVDTVQVFNGRPGNGEAVLSRRAATNFIEDHETVRGGLGKDRRCFHHFNHEG